MNRGSRHHDAKEGSKMGNLSLWKSSAPIARGSGGDHKRGTRARGGTKVGGGKGKGWSGSGQGIQGRGVEECSDGSQTNGVIAGSTRTLVSTRDGTQQ